MIFGEDVPARDHSLRLGVRRHRLARFGAHGLLADSPLVQLVGEFVRHLWGEMWPFPHGGDVEDVTFGDEDCLPADRVVHGDLVGSVAVDQCAHCLSLPLRRLAAGTNAPAALVVNASRLSDGLMKCAGEPRSCRELLVLASTFFLRGAKLIEGSTFLTSRSRNRRCGRRVRPPRSHRSRSRALENALLTAGGWIAPWGRDAGSQGRR